MLADDRVSDADTKIFREHWPSRLVATAEEERMSFRCNSTGRLRQPAIAEQSRLRSTRPSVQFSKGHTGLFSGQVVRDPSS